MQNLTPKETEKEDTNFIISKSAKPTTTDGLFEPRNDI